MSWVWLGKLGWPTQLEARLVVPKYISVLSRYRAKNTTTTKIYTKRDLVD